MRYGRFNPIKRVRHARAIRHECRLARERMEMLQLADTIIAMESIKLHAAGIRLAQWVDEDDE